MMEIVLDVIAIFIIYRIVTHKERRQRRRDKLVWFLVKHKLKRLQREGKLDNNIDLDLIANCEIDFG